MSFLHFPTLRPCTFYSFSPLGARATPYGWGPFVFLIYFTGILSGLDLVFGLRSVGIYWTDPVMMTGDFHKTDENCCAQEVYKREAGRLRGKLEGW